MKKVIFYWLPLILFMCLIFYLSSIPNLQPITTKVPFIDKWEHLVEYFILSFLIFRTGKQYKVKNVYLIAISFSALYGLTDEFHQLFVVNRCCSGLDMLANYLGSSLIIFGKLFKNSSYSSNARGR